LKINLTKQFIRLRYKSNTPNKIGAKIIYSDAPQGYFIFLKRGTAKKNWSQYKAWCAEESILEGMKCFDSGRSCVIVRAEHVRSLVNHANNLKVPRKAPVELQRLTLRQTISLSPTLK